MKLTLEDANVLMHEGAIALAQVEANGMRVDVPRLERTIGKVERRIKELEGRLREDDVFKTWRKIFGQKTNLGSGPQLGRILFGELGYKSKSPTRTGKPQVDQAALEQIDLPFVKQYVQIEKLKKLRGTYLKGLLREVEDGFAHAVFNLHLVTTYRSSASDPNSQNIPVRDKQTSKLIRSCFIPRDGHVLVEIDYKGVEVGVVACYNKDPVLIKYIEDPTKDLHRDMAAKCYMLPKSQVTKDARFYAKNQFVFPEFYGDYYIDCARNLWDAIRSGKLKTEDGLGLKEHLESEGIDRLGKCNPKQRPEKGTFEYHVHQTEKDFWKLFAVYAKWKDRWWRDYQRTGGFTTLTGFRIEGLYRRNQVINCPVQGTAFHCLLWSLIRLVRIMKKKKMRSKIVAEVHDSMVADVHKDELDDFIEMAKRTMTEDIRKAWAWLIVPLAVDVEVSETNWFEMSEVKL